MLEKTLESPLDSKEIKLVLCREEGQQGKGLMRTRRGAVLNKAVSVSLIKKVNFEQRAEGEKEVRCVYI